MSHYLLLKQHVVTFYIVLLCTHFFIDSVANANENDRADSIISLFKTNKPASAQQANNLLHELENLLTSDDLARQKELIRLRCWNQKTDTNEQISAAIAYADKQLVRFSAEAPSPTTIDLTICKTAYQRYLGQVATTLQDLTQAINQAYDIEAPLLIAHGRSQRGALHSYQGNYSASLEDLLAAQEYYESQNLSYWANINLGELAASYRRFGDAKTALRYQLQLADIYAKQGNQAEANYVNIQIASSLEQLGQLEEANQRYQSSQQFFSGSQPVMAADMSMNIANNLITLGQYQQALSLLQQAATVITPDYNAPYSFLQLYLANAQLKLNHYPASLEALQKAENAFQIDKNQRGLIQVQELRSDVYAASENWQDAYFALHDHLELHLAQDKTVLTKLNAELQTRFDTDRIKHENSLLLQRAKDKETQLILSQRNQTMQIIIIALVGVILILVSIFAYKQRHGKHQFKKLAFTDELTQIANRREAYMQAEQWFALSQKHHKAFSLISFDADHFKGVNDKFGHDIGDKVLIHLASIASDLIRKDDLVGRVGGEEFIIVLPNSDIHVAQDIANRLLRRIEQYDWSLISSGLKLTASAGVVSYQNEHSLSELLLKADKALYAAKSAGRNKVEVA
ncbi:GGDEF domain-containing protein [Paraglaciecola sp.]|uniref:tetratricopeptide repeat-containing diguanylate cyclase n=1 Tax=Paraglaciecola sp. TaxID=1920173 RepID=UPI00273DEFDF|nr:GGDEF domain-containing protein [Paraglaciecola sp.]MDP5031886.1 diguanylate cyclase [Paraglaciecola sp.]